jgi:hypothetical protein
MSVTNSSGVKIMTDWSRGNLRVLPRGNKCCLQATCDHHTLINQRKRKISKDTTMQQQKRSKTRKDRRECIKKPKKRERTRQDNVNIAFGKLRDILPTYPADKKLSKCQILRLAVKYITLLDNVLEELGRPSLNNIREDTC